METSMITIVLLLVSITPLCAKNKDVLKDIEAVFQKTSGDVVKAIEDVVQNTREKRDASPSNAILRGYNVMTGSPYAIDDNTKTDPGFKRQIFNPTGNQGIAVNDASACTVSNVESKVVTNMQSFRENMAESALIQRTKFSDTEFSASATLSKVKGFFTREKSGAVSMVYAKCTKSTVTMKDPYNLPPYTNEFKEAIRELHRARIQAKSGKTRAFKRFIDEYGTHFMNKVLLGAEITETRFLKVKARQQLTAAEVINCAKNAFPGKQTCSQFSDSSIVESTHRVTKGAGPAGGSLSNWPRTSFVPVPVKMKLQRIVDLLSDENLQKEGLDNIDGYELRSWVVPLYNDLCASMGYYCELHYFCGIGDFCPFNRICRIRDEVKELNECLEVNPCDKVNKGGCQHSCIKLTATTAKCGCPSGYELTSNQKTCQPSHPCNRNNGGCDQTCNKRGAGFYCSCRTGFSLVGSTQCVYGCSWQSNKSPLRGIPIYQHGVKAQHQCILRCRDKSRSNSNINGANYRASYRQCFCVQSLRSTRTASNQFTCSF